MTRSTCLGKGSTFVLAVMASIFAFGQTSPPDATALQKARLLRELVAKGDLSRKAGAIETAAGAYYLAAKYLPNDQDLQQKVASALQDLQLKMAEGSVANMSMDEMFQFTRGADLSNPKSFGDYDQPTPVAEVASLKMLFDERLVGKLRIGVYSHQTGASLRFFLWKPKVNTNEVKKLYGPPTSEKSLDQSLVALYYGMFRLIATSSGEIIAVQFR